MKKVLNIVTMLCALGAAAALWVQAGSQFMKLTAGAVPLGPEEAFGQAQGQYISYEVAYPVASCAEEYYSGDPDRVRTYGYVVYDDQRQMFLYVVVPEQKKGDYRYLMENLELVAELRTEKDMEPIPTEGSLEPMDQAAIDNAVRALEDSGIVELYRDIRGDEAYFEAYYGDTYGEVMAAMCQALSQGMAQTEWYRLERGSINGLATADIWICVLAAGLSLLIAICCLVSLLAGGRERQDGGPSDSGSVMERFMREQRVWVEEWCVHCLDRARRSAYLSVAIGVVLLGAIGYFSKAPVQKLLSFHLPLGLLLGEVTALLLLLTQKGQSKPEKVLKRMGKQLRKEFPSPGAQEEFAEDFLKAGPEWAFQERKKDSMLYGRLGSRYWSVFFGSGIMRVVDVERLARVEPETVSGSVRSGKVRVAYESYNAKFYYEGTPAWEDGDKAFSFQTLKGRDSFMVLAGKKGAEGVKVREA